MKNISISVSENQDLLEVLSNIESRLAAKNILEMIDKLSFLKNKVIANKRLKRTNENIQTLELPPYSTREIKTAILLGTSLLPMCDILHQLDSLGSEVRAISNHIQEEMNQIRDTIDDQIDNLNLMKEIMKNLK